MLDEYIGTENRIDPIGTIVLARASRPPCSNATKRDSFRVLDLNGISGCILNGKILDRELIGFDLQAFAARARPLAREIKNGFVHSFPSKRDARYAV